MDSILCRKTGPSENDHYLRGHPLTKGLFLHLRCGLRSRDPCSVLGFICAGTNPIMLPQISDVYGRASVNLNPLGLLDLYCFEHCN